MQNLVILKNAILCLPYIHREYLCDKEKIVLKQMN